MRCSSCISCWRNWRESIAVTDGPRLVEPLKDLGYDNVVAELDAHSKTLGTDKIVFLTLEEWLDQLLTGSKIMITIIDYKSGNLKSISNGFKKSAVMLKLQAALKK